LPRQGVFASDLGPYVANATGLKEGPSQRSKLGGAIGRKGKGDCLAGPRIKREVQPEGGPAAFRVEAERPAIPIRLRGGSGGVEEDCTAHVLCRTGVCGQEKGD
jgi:hypothetical protein